MAGERAKKTCYYELLGLDRKCEAQEIKLMYRKLALKMHPDKAHQSGLSIEEATKRFQQIQEAYSVLSDPQERAWYDAHREQILKGDDEPGEDPFKTKINLYKYFSTACFDGFGDGSRGFFTVYAELFEAIDAEEADWEDADEDHVAMPPFGRSDAEWADVAAFYRHWLDFCSRKAFGHADKWNPREAGNRQIRRAMEQENKKARQAAKKEFNAEVRQLVRFVQKRDPRVAAHQKQSMKATIEKSQRDQAEKEQRKANEARERQERKDAARVEEEERWAEVQQAREARRARGEVVSEDEGDKGSDEEELVGYVCEPCRKSFKSEKAFDQHTKSKKHLQIVAKLRRDLERQMQEEAEDEDEDEEAEEVDLEAGGASAHTAKAKAVDVEDSPDEGESDDKENRKAEQAGGSQSSKPARKGKEANGKSSNTKAKADSTEEEDDSGEGEDDEEDDFLARFAARKHPATSSRAGVSQNGKQVKATLDAEEEDKGSSSEDSEEDAEGAAGARGSAADGSGKRVQRRAQQMALLKQKQAERASVQDLVSNCKKAQRAAKTGAGEAPGDGAADGGSIPEVFAPPPRGVVGSPPEGNRCGVCGEDFESRTKLFQHIKVSGHALLKPGPPEDAGAAKGRKKKR